MICTVLMTWSGRYAVNTYFQEIKFWLIYSVKSRVIVGTVMYDQSFMYGLIQVLGATVCVTYSYVLL
jgi:5-keto 4-deoxyuronate isomerase